MSEIDEYDAYNDSLDAEHESYTFPTTPHPDTPPESQPSTQETNDIATGNETFPSSPKSVHSDEFSAYDFSEFSQEDFIAIDASTQVASASPGTPIAGSSTNHAFSNTDATESEYTRPDASPGNLFGGPAIEIEVEQHADTSAMLKAPDGPAPEPTPATSKTMGEIHQLQPPAQSRKSYRSRRSPFDAFRSWIGVLSVTDLTSPSWCEVQFDYGLRQGRAKKLADRPDSFVTAEGNIISVNKDVAVVNDKVVSKGKIVHKALEREIHPEEIVIEVKTNIDRWGLRLINMISSVQSLMDQQKCREMPVFGVLHGEVIVGIIDGIERQVKVPDPSDSAGHNGKLKRGPETRTSTSSARAPSPKKACRSPSLSQRPISSFFPVSPSKRRHSENSDLSNELLKTPATPSPPPPRFQLRISDTKTRSIASMPRDSDTLPARLQLMLYHKLLSNLLAAPPSPRALDFDSLWTRLGISPTEHFSPTFVKTAGLDQLGSVQEVQCLRDLVKAWRHSVDALHVTDVNTELTVEYRSRRTRRKKAAAKGSNDKGKEKEKEVASTSDIEMDISTQQEEAEVQQALLASLESGTLHQSDANMDVSGSHLSPAQMETASPGTSVTLSTNASPGPEGADIPAEDPELQWAIHESLREADSASKSDATASPTDSVAEESADSDASSDQLSARKKWFLIGTKTFKYDEEFIDNYLTSVLEYWHGARLPRGVSLSETNRCGWCEYQEGCEWRAQKAAEVAEKSREGSATAST